MSMTLDRYTFGDRAYWQINVDGERLDGFTRKRDAVRAYEALKPLEAKFQRLVELDRDRTPEKYGATLEERKALTVETNQAYLAARRAS